MMTTFTIIIMFTSVLVKAFIAAVSIIFLINIRATYLIPE